MLYQYNYCNMAHLLPCLEFDSTDFNLDVAGHSKPHCVFSYMSVLPGRSVIQKRILHSNQVSIVVFVLLACLLAFKCISPLLTNMVKGCCNGMTLIVC